MRKWLHWKLTALWMSLLTLSWLTSASSSTSTTQIPPIILRYINVINKSLRNDTSQTQNGFKFRGYSSWIIGEESREFRRQTCWTCCCLSGFRLWRYCAVPISLPLLFSSITYLRFNLRNIEFQYLVTVLSFIPTYICIWQLICVRARRDGRINHRKLS